MTDQQQQFPPCNSEREVYACWGCGSARRMTLEEHNLHHDHYDAEGQFCGEYIGAADAFAFIRKGVRVYMASAGYGTIARVHNAKPPATPEWCDVTWDVVKDYPPRVWHPVRYLRPLGGRHAS